jgi:ferric-dicitrate binding protein FerR (iron transport regulator)
MTPHLIERFFRNECTPEEAEAVSDHLRNHPDEVDEFFQNREWDKTPETYFLEEGKKQAIFERIRIQLKLKPANKKSLFRFAAAAAVLLVVTIGLLTKNKQLPVSAPRKAEVVYTIVKINYGNEDISLKLEDGSLVLLKPYSELQYPEHFTGKQRSFFLKGEARFKVAKDRSRPFIVHAGGTTTTALGTVFTISAAPEQEDVKIVLHEGRVVVKPEIRDRPETMNDIYLVAGEQVSVDKNTHRTVLGRSKPKLEKTRLAKAMPNISGPDLVFKNQSLGEVYRTLEQTFDVRIAYPDSEISDRYFTGTFKRDSLTLEKVIQETALLNDLTVERRGGNYYLSLKPYTNDKTN